ASDMGARNIAEVEEIARNNDLVISLNGESPNGAVRQQRGIEGRVPQARGIEASDEPAWSAIKMSEGAANHHFAAAIRQERNCTDNAVIGPSVALGQERGVKSAGRESAGDAVSRGAIVRRKVARKD